MPITSLTISSEKLDADNPSSIAILESLPYVVSAEADDDVTSATILVSIRKVSDDSVVMQRRHRVNTGEEIEVASSFEAEDTAVLRTSASAGNYYLYAEIQGDTDINTGPDLEFKVVLMTPWQVRNTTFLGLDLIDFNGNPLDDTIIRAGIVKAIGQLETDLGILLTPKVVKTRLPDQSVPAGAEVVVDPLTYRRPSGGGRWSPIQLRHAYVSQVTSLKFYYGGQLIYTVPQEWISIRRKSGNVRIIPSFTPALISVAGLPLFASMHGGAEVADAWHVEYIAGWNEAIEPYPPDLITGLDHYIVLQLGVHWGDALSPGISNSSMSMDGVSASIGTTASAIYNLLSSKTDHAKHHAPLWLKQFKKRHRPPVIRMLGR